MSIPAFPSLRLIEELGGVLCYAPGIQLPSFIGNNDLIAFAAPDAAKQTDLPGAPHEIVDHNGSTHAYRTTLPLPISGADARSVLAVVKQEDATGNFILDWGVELSGRRFGLEAAFASHAPAVSINAGRRDGSTSINDGEYHSLLATSASSLLIQVQMHLDGEVESLVTTGSAPINTITSVAYIGRNVAGNSYWGGKIALIAWFDAVLSAANASALHDAVMSDLGYLNPVDLRAGAVDGSNLRPGLTTSSYGGGSTGLGGLRPALHDGYKLKPGIAGTDGTLKPGIAK